MAAELFGREPALTAVHDLIVRLVAGTGGVLVLEGSDGSGKSAVLAAAGREARGAGARVVAVTPAAENPDALDVAIAGGSPLLLIVDDAQELSGAQAGELATRARGAVALLLACRGRCPWADELAAARVWLGALRGRALEQLCEALLPSADVEARRLCALESGGNPRLAAEVAAILAERGRVLDPAEVTVPGARARLLARLPEHGPLAEAIAVAVAVLAPEARLDDAAALAGCAAEQAAPVLDALVADEDLEPAGEFRYSFRAPVLARSLLGGVGATRLGLLHDRAARLLVERGAPPEQVGPHLLLAPPAATPEHVVALRAAGVAALERGDPVAAVQLLRRARQEPPAPDQHAGLLVDLGMALAHVDVPEAMATLEAAVRESEPGPARARAGHQLGRILLIYAGRNAHAALALTRALDELPEGDPRRAAIELARLNAARGTAAGDPAPAGGLDAVLADDSVDISTRRAALAELALDTVMQAGDRSRAVRFARTALADDALLRLDGPYLPAAYAALAALMWCGEYGGALGWHDALVGRTVRGKAPAAEATARYYRGRCRLAAGQVSGALEDARRVVTLEREGFVSRRLLNQAVLAGSLLEAGEPRAAAAALDLGGSDRGAVDADRVFWLMAAASVAHAEGRPAEAQRDYGRAGEVAEELGAVNPAVVPWRSGLALSLAAGGRSKRAAALVDDDLERLRAFGGPPDALARALRVRAAVGSAAGRRGLLEEAAALVEPLTAGLERAHTMLALGRVRRAARDREGAVSALRVALEAAVAGGALSAERDARAELSALGVRPRRTAQEGLEALTPSELRVAQLVAAGLTNREVAEALFVSPRTVEHHLTAVFRKLSIVGREALGPLLGEKPSKTTGRGA